MTRSFPSQLEYTLAMVPGIIAASLLHYAILYTSFVAAMVASGANPLRHYSELLGLMVLGVCVFCLASMALGMIVSGMFCVINWSFDFPISSSNLTAAIGGFTLFLLTHWMPQLDRATGGVILFLIGPAIGVVCGTLITYRYEQLQKICSPEDEPRPLTISVRHLFALTFWVAVLMVVFRAVPDSLLVYALAPWCLVQFLLIAVLNQFSAQKNVAANI